VTGGPDLHVALNPVFAAEAVAAAVGAPAGRSGPEDQPAVRGALGAASAMTQPAYPVGCSAWAAVGSPVHNQRS
jgi:hypothetical protein